MNSPTPAPGADMATTEFNGDSAALCLAIDALLTIDASGCLVPHGLGGHARTLLNAASLRLAASLPAQVGAKANFCARCGKRLGAAPHIHTCTPPAPITPASDLTSAERAFLEKVKARPGAN